MTDYADGNQERQVAPCGFEAYALVPGCAQQHEDSYEKAHPDERNGRNILNGNAHGDEHTAPYACRCC